MNMATGASHHILLIHGMWMIHEMMLPYVDKLRDDYHIIAPDLTGHGSDTGRFESAQKEASEIVDWLVQNQMTELALVFGASLGGVIAMDVISNETVLHTHCAVMEGASLTRVRGVEWLFRAMFCAMKKHPETIANMYASLPELDEDAGRMLSDTMARTDKEMLSNLVHSATVIRLKRVCFRRSCKDTCFLSLAVRIRIWSVRSQLKNIIPEQRS